MQKSALRITFPDCFYESALVNCGLPMLLARCDEASRRLISNIKESGFLAHALVISLITVTVRFLRQLKLVLPFVSSVFTCSA